MIKITKNDAFAMRELGFGYAVKRTYSKHPTYYLVEEPDTEVWDKKKKEYVVVKNGALSSYYFYKNSIIQK